MKPDDTETAALDDVIHVLGVEDSDVTPAERAREWLAEIERLRAQLAAVIPIIQRALLKEMLEWVVAERKKEHAPHGSIYPTVPGAITTFARERGLDIET